MPPLNDPIRRDPLSDRQLGLRRALEKKDPILGKIYSGVYASLQNEAHPDGIAVAAYEARELMDLLPRHMDFPIEKGGLGAKTKELKGKWDKFVETGEYKKKWWPKKKIERLKKMLAQIDSFFTWHEKIFPLKREEALKTLRALDGYSPALPSHIEGEQADEWMTLKEKFNNIAHHNSVSSRQEVEALMSRLETLLQPRLAPETKAEFDKMGAFINEAEGPDQGADSKKEDGPEGTNHV